MPSAHGRPHVCICGWAMEWRQGALTFCMFLLQSLSAAGVMKQGAAAQHHLTAMCALTNTRIQTNMQLLWAAMMGERELSNMNLFHSCKQAVMSCVCSHTVWRLKNEINVNTLLWPTYAIQHYTRCCSWPRNQLTSISLQRTGGICLLQKNVEKAEKPIAFQNNQ